MATKVRFHLDEHIAHDIAKGLRRRGIDVTTTIDAGLRTRNDEEQADFAVREQRIIVTNDAGFLTRNAKGWQHSGVVYYPQNSRSIGQVVTFLSLLHEVISAAEMINRVEFL